jgi:hypothetical protein
MKTKLICGMTCLNKRCGFCEAGKAHDPADCSKNYTGLSKGMEAEGVERRVKELWYDSSYCAYVARFISEDDSTMQARLRWPHAGAIEAGLIAKWPTYINKNNKRRRKSVPGPCRWNIPAYPTWQTRTIESVDTDPKCSSLRMRQNQSR